MFEVEEILDRKVFSGKVLYLAKWVGFPVQDATWESIKILMNFRDKIALFKEKKRLENGHTPKITRTGPKRKRGRPKIIKPLAEDSIGDLLDPGLQHQNSDQSLPLDKQQQKQLKIKEKGIEKANKEMRGKGRGRGRGRGRRRNKSIQREKELVQSIEANTDLIFHSQQQQAAAKPNVGNQKLNDSKEGQGLNTQIKNQNQVYLQLESKKKKKTSEFIEILEDDMILVQQLGSNETKGNTKSIQEKTKMSSNVEGIGISNNQFKKRENHNNSNDIYSQNNIKRICCIGKMKDNTKQYMVEYKNGSLKVMGTVQIMQQHPKYFINFLQEHIPEPTKITLESKIGHQNQHEYRQKQKESYRQYKLGQLSKQIQKEFERPQQKEAQEHDNRAQLNPEVIAQKQVIIVSKQKQTNPKLVQDKKQMGQQIIKTPQILSQERGKQEKQLEFNGFLNNNLHNSV